MTTQERLSKPAIKARYRKVAEKMLGKSGEKPMSAGKAMRESGYTVKMADNPQLVTRRKTFREILDEMIPESRVVEVLNEQTNATDVFIHRGEIKHKPDNQARLKAADMILKVRGDYAAEKHTNLNLTLADLRKAVERDSTAEGTLNGDADVTDAETPMNTGGTGV